MDGGTRHHSRISVNVISALSSAVRGGPCQVFNADMKVRIDARNYVYPDVAVSCDTRDTTDESLGFISYPILIVEVLSDDSTAAYDHGDKFTLLYQRLDTVLKYVLVESKQVGVTVYRRKEDGSWPSQSYGRGEEIPLRSIGATLPIASLYAGIALS